MNILNITKSLHERINSATSLDEILILTKTIERLNLGTVKTVSNYSDLLLEYSIEGEVYFVENEEQLYYGFNGLWFLIFRTATTLAYGWGGNTVGEIGDNTTVSKSSPVLVAGGFTDWTQIGNGIGLRADGTIWTWNGITPNIGQNGDGTLIQRSSPAPIIGGFTDWISISSSNIGDARAAIRRNGTLWAWGNITGDGTTSSRSSPVLVAGGFTDWTQITTGVTSSNAARTLGLRKNGSIWGWGSNSGALGNNGIQNVSSPVSVIGGFTWTFVTTGNSHTLAIRNNGTMWGFGSGTFGALGDGTTSQRSSPVAVVGGFTDWISAAAGSYNSIGLRSDGTLWAWGNNITGQLGDNTIVSKSSPVSVVGGFTDWVSVSASYRHILALRSNGTLWSWGQNNSGELGDNTTSNRSSPVAVVGGFTDWVSVGIGDNSHAIRSTT